MMNCTFTKEELEKRYQERLDTLLDECDWISVIDSQIVCTLVVDSLTDFGVNIEVETLHKLYIDEIRKLGLTDKEWRDNYLISDIIGILYVIIQKNF